MRPVRTADFTCHTVGPAHYVIVRRSAFGWLVEENDRGHCVPLTPPIDDRDETDLLAEAYAATRTHHTAGETSR